MNAQDVVRRLRKWPAVHQLCAGAFIQEPLDLAQDLYAVPMAALGFGPEVDVTVRYVREILGREVDAPGEATLAEQGAKALPTIALVKFFRIDAEAEELEAAAERKLQQGRSVLAWVSGDDIRPFAMATVNGKGSFFRLTPPHSRRRRRLGFGNTGEDFRSQLKRMFGAIEKDEHFDFALGLYHDAVRERNPEFRAARYFAVLECLAYKLKSGERGSRAAVRFMLGLEDGAMVEHHSGGSKYRYDIVELAGRLRDKLFHGVPFDSHGLHGQLLSGYEHLEKEPQAVANSLAGYCELELAKWANGASLGLKAAKGELDDP